MLEINVYSSIEHQPYEYAHENDIKEMPDMWTDMAFSGDVAREFEQWEQEIEDELRFDMKQEAKSERTKRREKSDERKPVGF